MAEKLAIFGAPFDAAFFRKLQQLKIHTRRTNLGSRQGVHRSQRRGQGLEFADYRLYSPGDDFRHIDWNTYARTDRLYLKQFREEQDLNVVIIIDGSASMDFPVELPSGNQNVGTNKFELAKRLALALGYVAMTAGDSVSFAVLGQKMTSRFRGAAALSRAVKELQPLKASGAPDLPTETRAALSQLKLPGKCFYISDFMVSPKQAISALDIVRLRNFDLSVIQLLAPEELSLDTEGLSTHLLDAESGEGLELALNNSSRKEYAKLLAAHVHEIEEYCRRTSVAHLLISSADSVEEIIIKKLPAMGLLK